MHQYEQPVQQFTFQEVCAVLRRSRSGLYRLMSQDPTFPRPRKQGGARSCRVYFYGHEIAAWQRSRAEGDVLEEDASSQGGL